MKPPSSLETILAFQSEDILARFASKFSVSRSEAREIFEETLKLLWLMALCHSRRRAGQLDGPRKITVHRSLSVIDEMWHNFMLFSVEYSRFCESHFGYYVHHLPTTESEKARMREEAAANPEEYDRRRTKEIEAQCRFICENLGVDTLTKWYKEFPKRFPAFSSAQGVAVAS